MIWFHLILCGTPLHYDFCRLGPPDFYPQTPNCPEETLTKEYAQAGYKETVEGIEVRMETEVVHNALWTSSFFSLLQILLGV
jgi:hypothetical protein